MGPGQQSPEPRAGRRDGLRQGGQCRSGAVDEQSAQVAVAASTDPQKLRLTSSRVLARYQAEPSRQIACPAERGSIVHSGNERSCRERADAGNGHQSSRHRIRPRPGDKLGIERPDALIDASPLFPKIAVSRLIRLRRTTAPSASSPTKLQLDLPRSIPRTAIIGLVILTSFKKLPPSATIASAGR